MQKGLYLPLRISIHEVFADLDAFVILLVVRCLISIHEVFADLDQYLTRFYVDVAYFNPRGLRRPRPNLPPTCDARFLISIHEVFADLDRLRW